MRTLVLNAGYEPLAVVSFQRALVLVMNDKATILRLARPGVKGTAAELITLMWLVVVAGCISAGHGVDSTSKAVAREGLIPLTVA